MHRVLRGRETIVDLRLSFFIPFKTIIVGRLEKSMNHRTSRFFLGLCTKAGHCGEDFFQRGAIVSFELKLGQYGFLRFVRN